MREIDVDQHNEEVSNVWEAYRSGKPARVPLVFGINPRFTLNVREANPNGVTFRAYLDDPALMLDRQLRHLEWVRFHVPQDAEMGPPKEGWPVYVDLQNTYEAAWLGCPLYFGEDQVPDVSPLLVDDRKQLLFDRGIPDPFTGGIMQKNWDYFAYFQSQKDSGYTYQGIPLGELTPSAMGTDGPFTIACNVRGATSFLADCLCDPEYARQLLDFITEATITRITAYRQHMGLPLKTPSWGFADDSIQLISEEMYKDLVFPYHGRLVNAFSEGGPNSIHLCGNATRHFPFLKEHLNIRSFDTGFPVDFAWLRETLGPDVEVFGGPSVPFLLNASAKEVRVEVRRILTSGIMEGGRFTLREGNNLAPGVPLENLWAMYDEVRESGTYR